MAYDPFQPQGQQIMASSKGVVIASDQTPVSVTGTVGASVIGVQIATGYLFTGNRAGAKAYIDSEANTKSTFQGADGTETVMEVRPAVFNGGTWDRLRGNSSIGALVSTGASSVIVSQGTSPWIVTGSVQATVNTGNSSVQVLNFPANQSVSGTVGSSVVGHAPVVIVGGSVATATTNSSVMLLNGSNVIGSVTALQGTNPWIVTGSVQGSFSPSGNQSVSGTVGASVIGTVPVTQSGTFITSLVSTVPSSVLVGASIIGLTPVAISGTPNVNAAGSVVAFQGTNPWVTTGSVQGTVSVLGTVPVTQSTSPWIITGSVQGAFSPSGNQSVSGTVGASVIGTVPVTQSGTVITSLVSTIPSSVLVGASIIGLTPVNVTNFPTTQNISGSVAAWLQSTNASVITVGTAAPNQSVSGTVGASAIGTVPTTQSGTWITSLVSTVPSSVLVGASIIGLTPVTISGTPNVNTAGSVVAFQGTSPWIVTGSVQTTVEVGNSSVQVLNFPTTQNVSGSVAAFQAGTQITSLVSTVPSSVIFGASIFGLAPVNVTNTNLNVAGSVAAFQAGTVITSLVSTVPSSVIFGASIFGLAPVNVTNTNLNVAGSVVAFQGTDPWVTTGSVQGTLGASVIGTAPVTQSGTWFVSVLGQFAEDGGHTNADRGFFTLGVRNDNVSSFTSADRDYNPIATDSAGRTISKPFASEDAELISYTGSVVSASVTLAKASAVGMRNYVTDYWIANTGSVTQLVTFRDGSTSVLGYTIAPAGGGSNSQGIAIPLKTAPSQDLTYFTTGTSSVVYVTIKGYQAP